MTISDRKEREKERRRNEIITAAEKIFFKKGVHKATMDEVAQAAELSKGALYLYFKSKDELHFAISIKAQKILQNHFQEVIDESKTGKENLIAIGQVYFQFAKNFPDYFQTIMHSITHHTEPFNEYGKYGERAHTIGINIINNVADIVRKGQEDGSITNQLKPLKLALLLWGQTTGVIQVLQQAKIHTEIAFNIKLEELLNDFIIIVENGLRPQ